MPLQDHFRPPLSKRRRWHSFHHAWATVIAFDLNRDLPAGFFADPNVQFGIEIDVATFEEDGSSRSVSWQPPAPTQTFPITLVTDCVEIVVYQEEGGPTLAGAIELVSPANKDRPDHRDAFVSKCAAYVQQGVGLVVVDVVTDRRAELHADLLARLNSEVRPLSAADLWAASYRPAPGGPVQLETWHEALAVGQLLPTLPFWLKDGPCIKVDFEASYERTRREQRMISSNGPTNGDEKHE